MAKEHFISYSSVDALKFARKLTDKLLGGEPSIPVWFDKDKLRPGDDWDEQIVEALRACRTVIFVMTPDSVTPTSVCKQEWSRALSYKKPIVPLLLDRDAEMPFRLGSRQYIDFTRGFEIGLAKLREHLIWLDSPEGELKALQDRLADGKRALPRARDENERIRISEEIDELNKQIEKQKRLIADPEGEAQRTEESIQAGLERERRPERPVAGRSRTKFINPPPALAPTYFQDRYMELRLIANFLNDPGKRMLTIVGRGGVGKTALVVRVLKALEAGQLPDDLGPLPVDGIVYLSAVGSHRVNLPNLFGDLCKLLPTETAQRLETLYKDPHTSIETQMAALLEAFPSGRFLVLLDNFETLVDAQTREMGDPELDEGLQAILEMPHHAVKVIITTRLAPRDLALLSPQSQMSITLDDGLPSPHAEKVLRALDADGKLGIKDAPETLLTEAQRRTRGFPRALEALYAILAADREITLTELLADGDAPLPENVVQVLVGEAYNRLDPLAQHVMEALAVYNRPVAPAAVDYLLQPSHPGIDSAAVLNRLVNMHFVHRESGRYYLHPADQEYALAKIPGEGRTNDNGASPASASVLHGLLNRAADYFVETRQPRATWKTLADLAPQLAEFELRCAATDFATASYILGEIGYDYLLLWGHYRLVINMHLFVQKNISDDELKTRSYYDLGIAYLAISSVEEAISCFSECLNYYRSIQNQADECGALIWLGNCFSALGDINTSIRYYQDALDIAQQTLDNYREMFALSNLGNMWAALGETDKAIDLQNQALDIAREIGDRPAEGNALSSLGNRYAELGEMSAAANKIAQALEIDRETRNRLAESVDLENIGNQLLDKGQPEEAIQHFHQALEIAEEIGFVQTLCYANVGLAFAYLQTDDLDAASAAAESACNFDIPENNHNAQNALGIIALRQGDQAAAYTAFKTVLAQTRELLLKTPKFFNALEAQGLAQCGLALCRLDEETATKNLLLQAREAFIAARTITTAPGTVARLLREFDALAQADGQGILGDLRQVAAGEVS